MYRDARNPLAIGPHETICQMSVFELKLPHSPLPTDFFQVSYLPTGQDFPPIPHFYQGVAYRFSCRLDDRLLLSPCSDGLVQDQGSILGDVAGPDTSCFQLLD